MGYAHTAYAIYRTLATSVPTIADALAGRLNHDKSDARLRVWSSGIVSRLRIGVSVTGREQVPMDRAYVLMSNHQSHLDIPVLYAVWPGTLRMVAKAELFRMPIFGKALRASGFVEVDRSGDRDRAKAAMDEAARAIGGGVSIWIAPEGTRSEDGRLGQFKKGGFLLAQGTGAPIVPIAINGTRRILPKGAYAMRPGMDVRLTFGPPIPSAGRSIEALQDDLRTFLLAHVEGAV